MSLSRTAAVLLACGALGAGACGGDAPPEDPSQRQPGAGGGEIPAQDVAEVKEAMRAIRACKPRDPAVGEAVRTIVAVLEESGPEGRYESNDTLQPTNMEEVATRAKRALERCGATAEAQRIDAALRAA